MASKSAGGKSSSSKPPSKGGKASAPNGKTPEKGKLPPFLANKKSKKK